MLALLEVPLHRMLFQTAHHYLQQSIPHFPLLRLPFYHYFPNLGQLVCPISWDLTSFLSPWHTLLLSLLSLWDPVWSFLFKFSTICLVGGSLRLRRDPPGHSLSLVFRWWTDWPLSFRPLLGNMAVHHSPMLRRRCREPIVLAMMGSNVHFSAYAMRIYVSIKCWSSLHHSGWTWHGAVDGSVNILKLDATVLGTRDKTEHGQGYLLTPYGQLLGCSWLRIHQRRPSLQLLQLHFNCMKVRAMCFLTIRCCLLSLSYDLIDHLSTFACCLYTTLIALLGVLELAVSSRLWCNSPSSATVQAFGFISMLALWV